MNRSPLGNAGLWMDGRSRHTRLACFVSNLRSMQDRGATVVVGPGTSLVGHREATGAACYSLVLSEAPKMSRPAAMIVSRTPTTTTAGLVSSRTGYPRFTTSRDSSSR
ncbi:hypothetical protein BMS3Bbin01_00453 [bacterium BMS3Bbin01]|nr:hypothetical protein BMS3Bbin01_00453 [bacterium BMS3Bbin01]